MNLGLQITIMNLGSTKHIFKYSLKYNNYRKKISEKVILDNFVGVLVPLS